MKSWEYLSLLLFAGVCGCGSMDGSSANGGGTVALNLVIQNPDPQASGSAKAVAISSDFSQEKALSSSASVSRCTLSAAGPSSTSSVVDVPSGASTISATLNVSAGEGYQICVDCQDGSGAVNSVPIGFKGCLDGVFVDSTTSQTLSISALFMNLASRSSGDVRFIRISQDTSAQTQIFCGFNGTLSDSQKAAAVCNVELDTKGTNTNPGTVTTTTSSGLLSTKSNPYFVIGPGLSAPACVEYNSAGTKILRGTGSWTTDASGNTVAKCAIGVAQMKSLVSKRKGRFAATASLSGTGSWVALPSKGMAEFNVAAGGDTDVATLTSDGNSCTAGNNGAECGSGFCGTNSVCLSASPLNLAQTASDFVGPAEGCYPSCPSDLTGQDPPVITNGTGSAVRFGSGGMGFQICLTPDGSKLYVPGYSSQAFRQVVVATGVATTVAGSGFALTNDGIGTSAGLSGPWACVVNPSGTTLYFTMITDGKRIRKMDLSTFEVTTLAGGLPTGFIDAVGTAARFSRSDGVTIDSKGENLYIADTNNHAIRKMVLATNAVTTLAGNGTSGYIDATGTAAYFKSPGALVIDPTDTFLYVNDVGNRVLRKIVIASGEVSTLAGSGTNANVDGTGTQASFVNLLGLVIDPTGSFLYVGSTAYVRKVNIATQEVTTFAGSGSTGDTNGTGSGASFNAIRGLAISPDGKTLFISDYNNNKIRKIQ